MTIEDTQNQPSHRATLLSAEIAQRLQQAMAARGINSQMRLAKASGVPQATISRVLKGGTDQGPELETLRRLANATGVHLIWLQEGTGPRDVGTGELPPEESGVVSEDDYNFAQFGDRLRYALKVRGLRQAALAEELGITDSAVSQFCKSESAEGGGRYVHEISEFVGVDKLWLRLGDGLPKFRDLPARAPKRAPSVESKGNWLPAGLSTLQLAALESLAKVMQAGQFDDMACLDFLQQLKPALAKLSED